MRLNEGAHGPTWFTLSARKTHRKYFKHLTNAASKPHNLSRGKT